MAHGDYTGQQKAELARRFADQQALAAKNMSLVSQVVLEAENETVDLMSVQEPEVYTDPNTGEEIVVEVDVEDPSQAPVTFRARETIEGVTVGKDNHYDLEEGRQYRAPRWVAEHFDRQGLVYH
jgi:hypothetical protein